MPVLLPAPAIPSLEKIFVEIVKMFILLFNYKSDSNTEAEKEETEKNPH